MATIKYVTCKDSKSLEALQDKAIKSVNSARLAIQIALVATAAHIQAHGDYTLASRLVNGLGNTVNGRAVVDWLVKFAALVVSEDGTGFAGLSKGYQESIKAGFKEAKATMWYGLKPQSIYKGFSLEQALQSVIKHHKAALTKAEERADDSLVNVEVNESTIKAILTLVKFDAILDSATLDSLIKAEVNKDQHELPFDAVA